MPGKADTRELTQAASAMAYALTRGRIHERMAESCGVRLERASAALLRTLAGAGTPMRTSDLAEQLLVRPPHVTRQVTRLAEEGLVERAAHSSDRRANLVHITRKGRNVVTKLDAATHAWLETVLHEVPAEDVRAAARVMRAVAEGCES
ncbi:MarR family winged helix-turn-helix transcriptional regulator [Sciscionella sediminilitoris]|uniref:MarR family winged helix-turn-helix transcriptional regulator n=1 Tax=Sciscionella sediminilitoris TaxID=1445613 RepID=UPI0009E95881|nr:MarR family transcriptional regulator [Sciscionella sp. SE31]